jgi:1-acyl-sn-glycerol-3-phosphate acyltransferase
MTRRGSVADWVQRVFFFLVGRPFLAFFIGLRIRGREHLAGAFPFLLVANHTSHLDTLSLLSLFPLKELWRVRPVAAADYFETTRVVSTLTRTLFNTLPIPRKNFTPETHPLKTMGDALDRGEGLILFPEGTRGMQQKGIAPFRKGAAHLIASRPGLRVVPVHLGNMGRSLPKGEWIPVPFFCSVSVGEPLELTGSPEEITARLEEAVRALAESSRVSRPG